jgi:feruloyl-CoA synthase
VERLPEAPVRSARILPPDTVISTDAGGRVHARSPHPLGPYPRTLTERLPYWAERAPDRTFLAARDADGAWRRLTYGVALDDTKRVAQALLDRGLSVERPIVVLSGNSLEHAVLALAAMHVGIPYAPIAPSYSLLSKDHRTLGTLWSLMRPGLVFADDGPRFSRALKSLPLDARAEVVTLSPSSESGATTTFSTLLETRATGAVDEAHAAVGPDTIAKILFTSGSTGAPKGVINTQRMLAANQEQIRTVMAFLADDPPVLCDWLPWNHTFGGNHNVGITLYNGGTMYLDSGVPTPAAFPQTIANLREIATTAYFNVPRGYELLLPALQADRSFARHFFSRLRMLFYAAAGLRQQVADEFERLAVETCGERIPWVTGLGATETAPFALCTGAMPEPSTGRVGVPVPGIELKVEPVGSLFEARVKGPNVTPGYWRDPGLTRVSFDEEGYYCMGDAIALIDPADPARGFVFQGRIADDFKLSTGTWVRVGPLRAALLAHAGDLVQDVAIAAPDRDDVRALIFPNTATARRLAGAHADAPLAAVLAHPAVVDRFRATLASFATHQSGSSTRIARAILVDEPPSIDAGEITDKGSLNQKAVLRHRRALVDALYGDGGHAHHIDVPLQEL